MRSCIWMTSAEGSCASTCARGTEAAATAFSLSSGVTTAYPLIFLSILTAMTRFLVVLCGVGGDGAGAPPCLSAASGRGEERQAYFFFAAFLAALRGAAFFAVFFAVLRGAAFFAAFFTTLRGAAFFVAFLA